MMPHYSQINLHDAPWAKDGTQSFEDTQAFAEYLAGMGKSISKLMEAQDSRTLDSFLEGAIGEMADFNVTTRAHKRMQTSSFSFSDLKDSKRPVTVFIGGDSSRVEAFRKVIEITTSNLFKELMRSKKIGKPVYVFANEVTNFKITQLEKYLTYLRSYKIKLFLYVQSLAAFRQTYGTDALQTLLSETEIKYVLAGQRDPETLKLLEELLGQTKRVKRSNSGNRKSKGDQESGLDGYSYTEETVPLQTMDQIRRLDMAILFLFAHLPALIDTPSIAGIWPFRHWQDKSPFFKKHYRERIKLRLWRFWWLNIQTHIGRLILKLRRKP